MQSIGVKGRRPEAAYALPTEGEGDVGHHALHSDSVFKQPLPFSHTHSLSRTARVDPLVSPLTARARPASFAPLTRGMERREAQMCCLASSCGEEAHRLTALHSQVCAVCASLTAIWRRFLARGAFFRDRTSAFTPRSGGFRRVRACPRPATEGRAT